MPRGMPFFSGETHGFPGSSVCICCARDRGSVRADVDRTMAPDLTATRGPEGTRDAMLPAFRDCGMNRRQSAQSSPRVPGSRHSTASRPGVVFLKFGLVGAVGFGIDYGMLRLLVTGWHWALARIPAFGLAVCMTWILNRTLTFGSSGQESRFATFLRSRLARRSISWCFRVW